MRIDESQLPIVIVECSRHPTAETMSALFRNLKRIASENRRVAYLMDLQAIDPEAVSTMFRYQLADHFEEIRSLMLETTVCEARVVSDHRVECIATAVDWLTGLNKWPCEVFQARTDARIWLDSQLRQERPAPRNSQVVVRGGQHDQAHDKSRLA